MAADERMQPHLVQLIADNAQQLLQQQLDFWSPETRPPGGDAGGAAAKPSKRLWDYDALEQRGIAQATCLLAQATCHLTHLLAQPFPSLLQAGGW
jgi:hypothetical protein